MFDFKKIGCLFGVMALLALCAGFLGFLIATIDYWFNLRLGEWMFGSIIGRVVATPILGMCCFALLNAFLVIPSEIQSMFKRPDKEQEFTDDPTERSTR